MNAGRLLSRKLETNKRRAGDTRTWLRRHIYGNRCWMPCRFHRFSTPSPGVGDVPSAGIDYNLILARPVPPPSVGKASFMRGHFDHRTNCSSTKHKEGLRSLLAIGGSSMKLSAPLYHLKRKA